GRVNSYHASGRNPRQTSWLARLSRTSGKTFKTICRVSERVFKGSALEAGNPWFEYSERQSCDGKPQPVSGWLFWDRMAAANPPCWRLSDNSLRLRPNLVFFGIRQPII